jgi:tape measure domain-containing protein
MTKIGSIYVEVRGDYTKFQQDLQAVQKTAKSSGVEISNALNNTVAPDKAAKGIVALTKSLEIMSRSAKVSEGAFKASGAEISKALADVAKSAGLSERQFAQLQERMLRTQAYQASEKALNAVARATGLSGREMERLRNQMSGTSGAFRSMELGVSGVYRSLTSLQGAIATLGVGYLAKEIFQAGVQVQSLQRAYSALTGSTEGAAQEFRFLREEAARLGLNFYDLAGSYKGYLAAARETTISTEDSRKAFVGFNEATVALGLSGESASRVMSALTQMMGKGKVQMEELRGQMGEHLPDAIAVFARALGVGTEQLFEMAKNGELTVETVIEAGKAYSEKYGKAVIASSQDAARSVDRLAEAWMDLKVAVAESGFLDAAGKVLRNLATAAKGTALELRALEGTLSSADQLVILEKSVKAQEALVESIRAGKAGMDAYATAGEGAIVQFIDLPAEEKKLASLKASLSDLKAQADQVKLKVTEEDAEKKRLNEIRAYTLAWKRRMGIELTDEERKMNAEAREEGYKAAEKAAEDRRKLEIDLINALDDIREDAHKKELERVDDELRAWSDAWNDRVRIEEDVRKDIAKTKGDIAEGILGISGTDLDKDLNDIDKKISVWLESVHNALIAGQITEEEAQRMFGSIDEYWSEAATKAEKDFIEKNDKNAQAFQKAWERGIERLDDAFADMWENMIEKGEFSMDSLKDVFNRTLAEMIHAATTRQIVVQISGIFNGQSGGSFSSGLGGMFGNLFGGGGSQSTGSAMFNIGSSFKNMFGGGASSAGSEWASAGSSGWEGAAYASQFGQSPGTSSMSNLGSSMGSMMSMIPFIGMFAAAGSAASNYAASQGNTTFMYNGKKYDVRDATAGNIFNDPFRSMWNRGGYEATPTQYLDVAIREGNIGDFSKLMAMPSTVDPVWQNVRDIFGFDPIGDAFGFGTKKTTPRVYFYGSTPFGSSDFSGLETRKKGQAGDEELSAARSYLEQVAAQAYAQVAQINTSIPGEYMDALEQQLKSSRINFAYSIRTDGSFQEKLQEHAGFLVGDIYAAYMRAFDSLGINGLPFDMPGGSAESRAKALAERFSLLGNIEEMLNPTSGAETAIAAAASGFDNLIESMRSLGFTSAKIAEVEGHRADIMRKATDAALGDIAALRRDITEGSLSGNDSQAIYGISKRSFLTTAAEASTGNAEALANFAGQAREFLSLSRGINNYGGYQNDLAMVMAGLGSIGSWTGSIWNPSTNADGGPVGAGEWSWVGEKGPELVQFSRPGRVFSSADSGDMFSSLAARIESLEATLAAIGAKLIEHERRSYRIWDNWEVNGLPATRS